MLLVQAFDFVDVLAHPWSTWRYLVRQGIADEWRFASIPTRYLRELVQALVDHGKAIELNGKARVFFGEPAYREFMGWIREAGVPVAVGSDAHSMERVGRTLDLDAFLREMGFGPEQVWRPGRHNYLEE